MLTVSIIIPTWNGLPLLQTYLPALLAAKGVADTQLIIADDGSTDGTAEWVAAHVPQARLVRQETNAGFAAICNAALQHAGGEFVLLLNNDVRVSPDFLPPLVQTLHNDPAAFAVNSRILLPDGRDEGQKRGRFHHAMFYVDTEKAACLSVTPYATACAALYRRRFVAQLGGFDTLLSPAYWEDADLCYRAARRGWTSWYQPESVVYHEHQATTGRINSQCMTRLRARNGFLFQWKNFPVGRVAQSLTLGAVVGVWQWARRRDPSLLHGYRDALRLWGSIAGRRESEQRAQTVESAAVLAQWTGELAP